MADDIFHHHDRVIDQDADGKDEREKRDAIEGETEKIKNQQGKRERGRNGERDDSRFAPAEREPDEDRHADDRQSPCGAAVRSIFPPRFRRSCA